MRKIRSFTYGDVLGGFAEGITRRDPSPVILVDGTYYVWYSRSTVTYHGYTATIWYATSEDGIVWTERGRALGRGKEGAFDDFGVFTPSIFIHSGQYYLSYTGVAEPFYNGLPGQPGVTPTAIGLAVAQSPEGPWERIDEDPILRPSTDPELFDSMRVDDSCFIIREGRIWLYYKGRPMHRQPDSTMMGLAIADSPEGPYIRSEANPVVRGGHEVCVWPHAGGVGSLHCNIGPAGNTLQWSSDGVGFEEITRIVPPKAPGPYREDNFADGVDMDLTWGLCIHGHPEWPWLQRFKAEYEE